MVIRHFSTAPSLAFLCVLQIVASAAAPAWPNILLIFSDDHAYQAISTYNDPRQLVPTPNLDRLANEEGFAATAVWYRIRSAGPSRAAWRDRQIQPPQRVLQQFQ